jgi:hypothetical protein
MQRDVAIKFVILFTNNSINPTQGFVQVTKMRKNTKNALSPMKLEVEGN